MCLLYPSLRIVYLAGFHLPGDPYFPDNRNGGWLEEDPEEDPDELSEEEEEEGTMEDEGKDEEKEEEDSEAKSEVDNPPVAEQHIYVGPAPFWAEDIRQWSRDQDQRFPYGKDRDIYDLRVGGLTNRALPVMVRCTVRLGDEVRTHAKQLMEFGAALEVHTARFRRLDEDND